MRSRNIIAAIMSARGASPSPPANAVNDVPAVIAQGEPGQFSRVSAGVWTGASSVTQEWHINGVGTGQTGNTFDAYAADAEAGDEVTLVETAQPGSVTQASNMIEVDALEPEATLSRITSNHVYSGSDRMLIYEPPNIEEGVLYPVVVFGHGNGERGIPSDNTYSVGTGNGSQTAWSGNLNNTQRIIHSEFVVEVNGVPVATGRFGVISGAGVSGTYDYDDGSSAAFTLNFTTPVTNSHAIQIKYTQSNLLGQGPFRYANLGDEPANVFLVAPQISAAEGGFNTADHWEAVIAYMIANDYPIDLNRLYVTGLSLGGIFGILLLSEVATVDYPCAAFVDVAPGATAGVPASGAAAWSTTTRMGKLIVRGTSDTNGQSQLPSAMANCNNADREFPMQGLVYWNIGHSASLWDTKVYNRKNRTDATGTAEFDYIDDFLKLFSLDAAQQAELWTERAELTEDSGDYRIAKRQTDNLSSGDKKTELLSRLATVKSAIGKVAIIDVGTAFRSTSGNYNNLTNSAAGTTISNLIDTDGGSTTWDFEMDVAPASTPGTIDDIGSQRVQGRQFGFELNTTRDGHRIGSEGTTGTMLFTDLNNAKTYTIKVYAANQNTGSPTARAEIEVVFNSTTKHMYVDMCNFGGGEGMISGEFVVFTGLSPSSGTISGTIRTRQTTSTERESWLQAIEIIEEP